MATTTNVKDFKINYLTDSQYASAKSGGNLDKNQLYMTPEDTSGVLVVTTDKLGSSGSPSKTFSEVDAAIKAGKDVVVRVDNTNFSYRYTWSDTDMKKHYFTAIDGWLDNYVIRYHFFNWTSDGLSGETANGINGYNGLIEDVLWKNNNDSASNMTTTYAPATITTDKNMTNYTLVILYYANQAIDGDICSMIIPNYNNYYFICKASSGTTIRSHTSVMNAYSVNGPLGYRICNVTAKNKIYFGNAKNTSGATDNTLCLPLYVVGYKYPTWTVW